MSLQFISIGFGNVINASRVVAVVMPDTLPSKRLLAEAKELHKLIDASCGRKTRALVITDTGHVILCGLQTDTIFSRLNSVNTLEKEDSDEND